MPFTNRSQNELERFFNPNELLIDPQEFQEIFTVFQMLRKWKNEDHLLPEAEIEPKLDCEP